MPSSNQFDRRTLLHNLVQGGLALSLVPNFAESAWSAIAAEGIPAPPRILNPDQTAMVALIADIILPRTDTPGATDMGVVPWIDTVVAQYFSSTRRAKFLADLNSIDAFAMAKSGARLTMLNGDALTAVMAPLDAACGLKDLTPAQRGYVLLKEMVIFGYFTSKPVQQDILKVVVVPGRFDGDVSVAPKSVT